MADSLPEAVEIGGVDSTKGESDKNHYRLLRLKNGMRVLLVSELRYGSGVPASEGCASQPAAALPT